MGACQSAPTTVETFAPPPVPNYHTLPERLAAINLELAEFNRLAHAELHEALSRAKSVDDALARWRHDMQLREFARSRGTDMRLFEQRLAARRATDKNQEEDRIRAAIASI
jgi:hypothetical protein